MVLSLARTMRRCVRNVAAKTLMKHKRAEDVPPTTLVNVINKKLVQLNLSCLQTALTYGIKGIFFMPLYCLT